MNAWQSVRHLAAWDLRRMRWWVMLAILTALGQAFLGYSEQTYWFTILAMYGVDWPLLLFAAVLVQGDSPLSATAFHRGKPLPWWMLPLSKGLVLLLAYALPAMIVSIISIVAYGESTARLVTLLQRSAWATLVLGVSLIATSAATGSIFSLVGLKIASLVGALAVAQLFLSLKWFPWWAWTNELKTAATILVAASLYRRRWSSRSAMSAMLAMSVVDAMGWVNMFDSKPRSEATVISGDATVVLDSVSFEQPHITRVAFHLNTPAGSDGIRFDWATNVVVAHASAQWVGLAKPNERSGIRVERDAQGAEVRAVDPAGDTAVYGARVATSGIQRVSTDLVTDPPRDRLLPADTSRTAGVLVLFTRDSVMPATATLAFSGTARILRMLHATRLPLRDAAENTATAVHWRLAESKELGGPWTLTRSTLSTGRNPDSTIDLALGPPVSIRVIRGDTVRGWPIRTKTAQSGAVGLAPGLYRVYDVRTLPPPPLSAITTRDSVEIAEVSAGRAYRFQLPQQSLPVSGTHR